MLCWFKKLFKRNKKKAAAGNFGEQEDAVIEEEVDIVEEIPGSYKSEARNFRLR